MKHLPLISIIITIVIAIFFIGRALLPGTMTFTVHDETQTARIAEFTRNLEEFQIPPRMAPNFSFGMGYPVFNFYSPFSYWVTSGIYFSGFGIVDSFKLSILLAIMIALGAMYLFLRTFFPWLPALLGASLYITSPWLASEIFVRGNLGEVWFWALLPLSLYMLHRTSKNDSFTTLVATAFVLSYAFTVHNVMSVLFLPLSILYILLLPNKKNNFIAYALGLLLSAYFLVPAAVELPLTYARDIATRTNFADHFLCVQQLWSAPFWGYGGSAPGCDADGMSFMLGKVHIILGVIGMSRFMLYISPLLRGVPPEGRGGVSHKKNTPSPDFVGIHPSWKEGSFPTIFIFLLTSVALFMTLEYSRFLWNIFPFLAVLQFPWRFLLFGSFGLSFFAAYAFTQFKLRSIQWVIPLIILFSFFSASKYFVGQSISKNEFNKRYLSETYIKEEVAYKIPEYFPKTGSYDAWRAYDKTKEHATTHSFVMTNDNTPVGVLDRSYWRKEERTPSKNFMLNIHYFPFWKMYVDEQEFIPTNFDRLGRPIITTEKEGIKTVVLLYAQSNIEVASSLITFMTYTALIMLLILHFFKTRKRYVRILGIYLLGTVIVILGSILYKLFSSPLIFLAIAAFFFSLSYGSVFLYKYLMRAKPYTGKYLSRIQTLTKHHKIYLAHILVGKNDRVLAQISGLGNQQVALISEKILEQSSPEEIDALMTHEFGHLAHHDIALHTLVATCTVILCIMINMSFNNASYSIFIGPFILMAIVLPLLLAYSRRRERMADQYVIEHYPKPSALGGILRSYVETAQKKGEEYPVHPVFIEKLLMMHPWIHDRIAYLKP